MRPFPPPNARRAGFAILSMLAAAMLLALPTAAPAQPQTVPPAAPPSAAEDNWLYAGSDLPRDLAWQFGELPNGLRYAVRQNGVPPGQVSIRVRMAVRSEERRVGEEGVSTCRSRWSAEH